MHRASGALQIHHLRQHLPVMFLIHHMAISNQPNPAMAAGTNSFYGDHFLFRNY
jgi:hypothetical protein